MDKGFVFRIGERCGLVQDHDRRIFQNGPGKRDTLAFAARQVDALRADHRVQALGQLRDDVVALRRVRGRLHLRARSRRARESDVVNEAALEKPCVLEDEGNGIHQFRTGNIPHINTADKHPSFIDVPEPRNKACNGALASSRRPDERHRFSFGNRKAHVLDGRCVSARIRERHPFKNDIARPARPPAFRRTARHLRRG